MFLTTTLTAKVGVIAAAAAAAEVVLFIISILVTAIWQN